jgi:hypothetical protein
MYCGDTSLWSGAMSSATLKFTNGSGLNVSLLSFSLAAFGTVWNALTGGSVLQVNNTSFYNSAVNYKAGPGSITSITSGSGLIATGIDVDGLGGPVAVIRSSSAGSQATITKVGGGALTLNYCSLKDISGNTAAYGGTYAARNSVDLGNNTNITFAKQPSGFMAFF